MKQPIKYQYGLTLKVRDYECDLQGVVNNSNYQCYMEHTRHEFWLALGDSFAEMHDLGLDLFVYKVSITYHRSLRSGDTFHTALRARREGAKLIFDQIIVRSDGVKCASGVVEAVAVQDGRTTRGECFDGIMTRAEAYSESHPYDLTILS
ncbi:acyl-CoA thioesterase [Porphyromonas uenonis]|uniref:acyl-CoA thioesterase n=1 Tax=Porphyromonas uenonis TaxID=281920 RepID=UPI0004704415|nr:acyl-CoA thioesterase [Porphyromonas uenonis]